MSGTAARRPTAPRCAVPATQPVLVGAGLAVRGGRAATTGGSATRAGGTVMNSTVV